MKRLKQATMPLAGLGLLVTSASSLAVPTLTYTTTNFGTVTTDPFDGYDWNSAASAVVDGFVADSTANLDGTINTVGTVFTTEFWADAVGVKLVGGSSAFAPLAANGFAPPDTALGAEFTIRALIDEIAVPTSGTSANFYSVGGTYNIWYEPLADADIVDGSGITDGTLILSGSIFGSEASPIFAGAFNASPPGGGSGNFDFDGSVTLSNPTYFDPTLVSSVAGGELKFGTSVTSWTQPTSVPGPNGTTLPLPTAGPGTFIFQADANQSFTPRVEDAPEPGILALVSMGLLGLTGIKKFKGRRRS